MPRATRNTQHAQHHPKPCPPGAEFDAVWNRSNTELQTLMDGFEGCLKTLAIDRDAKTARFQTPGALVVVSLSPVRAELMGIVDAWMDS
jgi:hypothetical protein